MGAFGSPTRWGGVRKHPAKAFGSDKEVGAVARAAPHSSRSEPLPHRPFVLNKEDGAPGKGAGHAVVMLPLPVVVWAEDG